MRESGILMHISSLPGPYGIGTMGKNAYKFVDFLEAAGQSYWQILPLTPTGFGDSPYQSFSACAGNHYLIDLDTLVEEGLLKREEITGIVWEKQSDRVDYGTLYAQRSKLLAKACSRFVRDATYEAFVKENREWLEEYAIFMALKNSMGGKIWLDWPEELKCHDASALAAKRLALKAEVELQYFLQYQFDRQWMALRSYANKKGIRIIGDVTPEKVRILQNADSIFSAELESTRMHQQISQYFAVLTDNLTVDITGADRTPRYTLALRAINTDDFMTARWTRLPYELLDRISHTVIEKVPQINRVVYDVTSKPPATIEWE